MMIGIYKITNNKNGKVYVGQSLSIEDRWKQHKIAIRTSEKSWYPLAHLESDGIDDFSFDVLQQCKPEELDELEEYWINYYESYVKGYNQTKDGGYYYANTQFVCFSKQIFKDFQENKNVLYIPFILLHKALKALTYSEFKLFSFLLERMESGVGRIALSPSELQNLINFATKSYKIAKDGLEKKGILIFDGERSFNFDPMALLELSEK